MNRLTLSVHLSLWLFLSYGCETNSKIVEHEGVFLKEFLNHSLLKRGDIVEVQVYKGQLLNDYFFQQTNESFQLLRSTTQFNLTDLPKYSKIDTTTRNSYTQSIERLAWDLYSKMRHANVSSFTSEFQKFGVDLMINIASKKLIYVDDTSKVNNPEWKRFLYDSKNIKLGWYVYEP